jgi:hypothetical protein
VPNLTPWHVEGDYLESCNCEAIFLGRAGGDRVLRLPWVRKPSFVLDVRPAQIDFDGETVRSAFHYSC